MLLREQTGLANGSFTVIELRARESGGYNWQPEKGRASCLSLQWQVKARNSRQPIRLKSHCFPNVPTKLPVILVASWKITKWRNDMRDKVGSYSLFKGENMPEVLEQPWREICCIRCWKATSDKKKCRCRCHGKHHGIGKKKVEGENLEKTHI